MIWSVNMKGRSVYSLQSIVQYILFAIVCSVLASCYTEKKAGKQLNKAYINHPKIVAKKSADWFPCVTEQIVIDTTSYKIDDSTYWKIIRIRDTIQYIYSDTTSLITKERYRAIANKLQEADQIINRLQSALLSKPSVITQRIPVKDSATLYLLNSRIAELSKDKDDYQKKYEQKMNWIIYLLIGLFLSIIINIIRK
jgi:hypothetical protein